MTQPHTLFSEWLERGQGTMDTWYRYDVIEFFPDSTSWIYRPGCGAVLWPQHWDVKSFQRSFLHIHYPSSQSTWLRQARFLVSFFVFRPWFFLSLYVLSNLITRSSF